MRVRRSSTTAPLLVLLVAIGALAAFGLGSCQMLGITKMDRLSQFGADLNGDWSTMSQNFAQGQTADYGSLNTQAYWTGKGFALPLSAALTYSVAVHDYVDPSNVTADIYGPPLFNPNGVPVPAVFVLAQIDNDWFIKEIYLNGVLTVQ
jgi:hypothetical protein